MEKLKLIEIAIENFDLYKKHNCTGLCNYFRNLYLHNIIDYMELKILHRIIYTNIKPKTIINRLIFDKRAIASKKIYKDHWTKDYSNNFYWKEYDSKPRYNFLIYLKEKYEKINKKSTKKVITFFK